MKGYEASRINDSVWQVKRYSKVKGSSDDESDYVECQVEVATDDEEVAIRAAIKQDSWA